MSKSLTKPFVISLVLLVLLACYLIFKPFLTELFVAVILVSIFYKPYQFFMNKLGGRRNLAALIMCVILVLVILLPAIKLATYAGQKSVSAYSQAVEFFNANDLGNVLNGGKMESGVLQYLNLDKLVQGNDYIKDFFLDILKRSSDWVISGATTFFKQTTNFIISLALIILAMFFFFVSGKKMLHKLMYLSPLPNRYDQEIFAKFRVVSYKIFVSTFLTAGAQGVVGAIGFAIVGFPALLAGLLIALLSLIPYVGSMIFYVPVGIYYLLVGQIWQGIFILAWGAILIGSVDNILRAYLIKGKAQVNPVFVLFSILGGIALFGFWGIVLGPLIVALAVTIFHIYELEFCKDLDEADIEEVEIDSKKTARRLKRGKKRN